METYYKGWLKFIPIYFSATALCTTMINYQIRGLESKIGGLENKIEGTNKQIEGVEGKIAGLTKIQEAQEMLLRDIRRDIQESKIDSNARFAEMNARFAELKEELRNPRNPTFGGGPGHCTSN